jgi:hypothetical protein
MHSFKRAMRAWAARPLLVTLAAATAAVICCTGLLVSSAQAEADCWVMTQCGDVYEQNGEAVAPDIITLPKVTVIGKRFPDVDYWSFPGSVVFPAYIKPGIGPIAPTRVAPVPVEVCLEQVKSELDACKANVNTSCAIDANVAQSAASLLCQKVKNPWAMVGCVIITGGGIGGAGAECTNRLSERCESSALRNAAACGNSSVVPRRGPGPPKMVP